MFDVKEYLKRIKTFLDSRKFPAAQQEVKNGLECGIGLKDFIDFKEQDIIESYLSEKIERTI